MFNPRILPAQNKVNAATKVNRKRKQNFDKRKRKSDRRESVRNGVIVSLSSQSDRRSGVDRRSKKTSVAK